MKPSYIRRPTTFYMTVLQCNHDAYLDPTPALSERLWCVRCDDYRKVKGVHAQYITRCNTCRRHQAYGTDAESAMSDAMNHAKVWRHPVQISLGTRIYRIIRYRAGETTVTDS